MNDSRKTRAQLIDELVDLRRRVADLEARSATQPATVPPTDRFDQQPATDRQAQREMPEPQGIEQALRTSEERFRLVTLATRDAIYDWDITSDRSWRNTRYHELFAPPDQTSYERWCDSLHPDNRDRVVASLQRTFEGRGDHWSAEYHFRRPDGQYSHVMDRGYIVRDAGGQPIRMIGAMTDITDRKRMEEALRNSEHRYRAIVEDQTEFICRWLPGGIHTFVNQAYCRCFDKNPEELLGSSLLELIPEQDREKAVRHFDSLGRDNPVATHEHRVITASGEIRWHQWTDRAILDESGNTIEYQSVGQDITERKQAEGELRDSEERYRAFFEQAADAILLINPETGALLEFNDRAYENLGYTREEFRNLTVADIEAIESPQEIAEHIARILEQGTDAFETKHRTKSGEIRDVRVTCRMISVRGRKLLQTIWIDITEPKRAKQDLQESEERFRALTESTSDWVWEVDADGVYTYASPRVRDLLGYHPREVIGRTPFDFMPPAEAKRVGSKFRAIAESRKPFAGLENTNLHKDGRLTVLETSGVPIFDAHERFCGYRGIDRDITRRKQSEQALRESEQKLAGIVASVTDHISMMDEDYTIVWANDVAKRSFGSDLVGKKCHAAYRGCDSVCDRCIVARTLADGGVHEHEARVVGRDGKKMDFWCTATVAARHEDGRPRLVVEVCRDITERKRAEEAQTHLAAILESTPDFVGTARPDGRVLTINKAGRGMLGIGEQEDLSNLTIPEIHPDWAGPLIHETGLPTAAREGAWRAETALLARDGRTIPVSQVIIGHKAKGGTVEYFSTIMRDISEHKRAEQALRESEERFRTVVTASKDAMVAIGEDGLVTLFNTAAERMFGRPASEVLGQPLDCLMPQEYREPHRKYVEGYFTSGKPYGAIGQTIELTAMRSDGHQFPIELSLSIGEHGGQRLALAIIRDITKRKEVQEELRRAQEELEQRVRDRTADLTAANRQLQQEITERKRVEEALRESEERFRTIFENAPIGVYRTTPDGRIINANPALVGMLGYRSFKELAARDLEEEGFEPEYERREFCQRLERDGTIAGLEAGWKRQDGSGISVRENATVVRDAQGRVVYYDGTVEDITERKRTEEALRDSEKLLRQVIDASPNCVFVKDREGRFLLVNKLMAESHGTTPEAMVGKTDYEFVGSSIGAVEDVERYLADDQEVIETRRPKCISDESFTMPDGNARWHQTTKVPLSVHGDPNCVLGVAVDVTERKTAERALQESQRTLSTLMSNLPGMVYRCRNDLDWTMEFVSDGCRDLTGYRPADLIDNRKIAYGQLIVAEDREHVWQVVQTALQARQPFRLNYRIRTVAAMERWVWEQGQGVFTPEGQLLALEGFITDVTERVQAEEALRRADRLAALGAVIASVAHELNNPLTSICGLAELLAKDSSLREPARRYADDIVDQAIRCGKIVTDMLGFARARPVKQQPIQVNEVVKRCMDLARKGRRFDDVEISEEYDPRLPEVMADSYRLEQVFINIIWNASDALRECDSARRFTVQTARADKHVEVTFTDNGPGIADLSRVFDPFYSTKPMGEGTGLGLSVSHGIIKEHGGSITAQNLSVGARFTVRLPIRPPSPGPT